MLCACLAFVADRKDIPWFASLARVKTPTHQMGMRSDSPSSTIDQKGDEFNEADGSLQCRWREEQTTTLVLHKQQHLVSAQAVAEAQLQRDQ